VAKLAGFRWLTRKFNDFLVSTKYYVIIDILLRRYKEKSPMLQWMHDTIDVSTVSFT
jgi:hypothetical protein